MIIRKAILKDAKKIADIYNQGIEERIATLETTTRTAEERRKWLKEKDFRHPVFVAVDNSEVVGWASLNVFNQREAYKFVGDISVYVDKSMRGKGIGKLLLQTLEKEARKLKYHKLVIAGFPFNIPAISLYTKIGFQEIGIYKEQGILDGKWVDVILMEKILS
jgi:phosphinothricin acetyltransferase